jgi:hypothetical protein
MLGSLLLLSVIRARFSPIGTRSNTWLFDCVDSLILVFLVLKW